MNGFLSDPLTHIWVLQGRLLSILSYNIATEVLASFINADKRIKGIQIGDHEIKIVNFADNTTIFLRDITCLDTRDFKTIWKFKYKLAQKIIFSKSQAFMSWCLQKQNWSTRATGIVTISIKILEVNFGKSILDNSKWDKIIEG